jgi:hypothetical protein
MTPLRQVYVRPVTTVQAYALVVLAIGASLALAGSRQAARGDVLSGTLDGGVAVGMILLAVVVRGL